MATLSDRQLPDVLRRSSRARGRGFALGLTTIWTLIAPTVTRSADTFFTWNNTNPLGGNWSNTAKWGQGTAPAPPNGADHHAYIGLQNVAAYTVTLDMNASIKSFGLDSPTATFVISNGKTLTVANASTLARGEMQLGGLGRAGTWVGPLSNAGTITAMPGSSPAFIDSSAFVQTGAVKIIGTQNFGAELDFAKGFENSGVITLDSPQSAGQSYLYMVRPSIPNPFFNPNLPPDPFTNPPTVPGPYPKLTNLARGTINIEKGALQNENLQNRSFSGSMDNKGIINVKTSTGFDSSSYTAGQYFQEGGSYVNTGTININGAPITLKLTGKSFENKKDAMTGAVGRVEGKGTVNISDLTIRKFSNPNAKVKPKVVGQRQVPLLVGPGPAVPEQLNIIGGDYDQTPAGILDIELDASSLPVHYGQLNVDGIAFLDSTSTIELSLLDGTNLQIGQEFPILTATALSGLCPTLAAPYIDGHYFSVDCDTPNVVTLRVDATPEPATIGALSLFFILRKPSRRRQRRGESLPLHLPPRPSVP